MSIICKSIKNVMINISILLITVFIIESCDYLTGPKTYNNITAEHTLGGVHLADYHTKEICTDGKQINNNTELIVIPDSSVNHLVITGLYIDSVLLTKSPYFENGWVTPDENYQCMILLNSNILQFRSNGGWKGMHTLMVVCKLTSPISGLEVLTPEKNSVEIELMFF